MLAGKSPNSKNVVLKSCVSHVWFPEGVCISWDLKAEYFFVWTKNLSKTKTQGYGQFENLSNCDMLPLLKYSCHLEAGVHGKKDRKVGHLEIMGETWFLSVYHIRAKLFHPLIAHARKKSLKWSLYLPRSLHMQSIYVNITHDICNMGLLFAWLWFQTMEVEPFSREPGNIVRKWHVKWWLLLIRVLDDRDEVRTQ